MKEKDYIPYGIEWKEELLKLPKIMIISLYRNLCLEKEELEQLYKQAIDAAGAQEQRAEEAEKEVRNILKDIER